MFCLLCSIAASILLIWFKSEAYIEYCKLFKLNKISLYLDYLNKKKSDISINYHSYLRQFHDNFFIRLITCPICFGFWVSLILGTLFMGIVWIFPIFIGSLILFGIIDKLLG